MPDVRYAPEKLGSGVQALATHSGRIQERLVAAFNAGLYTVDHEARSVPGMNRDARDKAWAAVTTAPKDHARGVFEPSIEQLSEKDASHVAQLIVSVDAMVDYFLEHQK